MTLTDATNAHPSNDDAAPASKSGRLAPIEIAPETFVIHDTFAPPGAPGAVHMNSMLIRGAQPVVVDTGAPTNREQYLEDLFSLVEPEDVRWVFISHDDVDHYGNMHEVMAACPNATLVASWFACDRIAVDRLDIPPTLAVAERRRIDRRRRPHPARHPAPAVRLADDAGLFDPTTGVYWASDCYATPVQGPTAFVDELDPDAWAGGFQTFQAWNSPWVTMLDESRFAEACSVVERLEPRMIASCHGPTIGPSQVDRAFELLRLVPVTPIPPQPDQMALDQIVATIESLILPLPS
ncbi:MAG: MBL fold metallo-hydrolase [Ilumatobacteraceae bacterium]